MFRAATPVLAGLLLLTACGQQSDSERATRTPSPTPNAPLVTEAATPPAPTAVAEADTGAPPPAFAQCAMCHSVKPGETRIGPSLAGVFGTKAGAIPGYPFSPAMKTSGLTWDEPTLDRFLTAPMKVVPGTRMTFAGIADAAKRQAVIAYLKTL
ncbi:MAG: c-type cytochrome [Tsuneonella sp.]